MNTLSQKPLKEGQMIGRWDYSSCREPYKYGHEESYEVGIKWLKGCRTLADWGAGAAYAERFINWKCEYIPLDGSVSAWVKNPVDLRNCKVQSEAIFMRHVLEHNPDWKLVLDNAVSSFSKKMSLILFIPLTDSTRVLRTLDNGTVDIAFCASDLESHFSKCRWTRKELSCGDTAYFLWKTL